MDPTREEMLEFLDKSPFRQEFDEVDVEEAIYWFASDYHSGQWSNLYSALSTSPFEPSPISGGCEDNTFYNELVSEFA